MAQVATRLKLIDDPYFNRSLRPSLVRQWKKSAIVFVQRYLPSLAIRTEVDNGPDQELSDTVDVLTQSVKITPTPRSRVIGITASAWDKSLAAKISNTAAEVYVTTHLALLHDANSGAEKFLTDRLEEIKDTSARAAQDVERYRNDHGLVAGATNTLVQEQATALSVQLLDARAKLGALQAEYTSAQSGDPEQLSSVVNSATMSRLRELEVTTSNKRAEFVARYGPDTPLLAPFDSSLSNTRTQIAAEARRRVHGLTTDLQAAKANVANLIARETDLRGQLDTMNIARSHLSTMETESASAATLYAAFLNRARETQANLSFPNTDVRILSKASVPTKPAFPNNLIMLPIAGFISVIFGSTLGFLKELRGKGLNSTAEVELLIRLPTLGMIPLRNTNDHNYRDAIENLLNCVYFGLQARSVLITSALPNEGKSMTSRALAIAAADRGIRVLLIDADMRSVVTRPTIGFADVLRGEVTTASALQNSPRSDLTILSSGKARDNPIRLLSLKPAKDVLERLTKQYELVIIDGPPVLAGGDCWMISQHVEQTILLAKWGVTSPVAIQTALKQIMRYKNDKLVAGIVLNMVDPRKGRKLSPADLVMFPS